MSAIPSEPRPDVDVVVIGGGVNGTGVARDCALRGLRVALLERNDLGFGASGNSSGMIHGGPRYLTYDPSVTQSSCEDSGHIQRIAPHLLFRIPFLYTVHRSRLPTRVSLALFDAFFDLYDRYQPLKRGKPHVRLTPADLRGLEPGLAGDVVGGVSFDEWGIDGVRLCVGNAVDARGRGADVRVHTTVTAVLRGPRGEATGVRYRDRITGQTGELRARAVVNATGAWAPITATLGGLAARQARIRPGKGIHVYYPQRLSNYAITARAIDGRQVFLMPWQNTTVIGTTDDDYYGDLDDVVATTDEARYLVQAVARVFPSITAARPIGTWGGVRPTLYAWGVNEDRLSREHAIVDHAADGAPGLFSMTGGKLASYRMFAQEMTDLLGARLGVTSACRTHTSPLPGGEARADPLALAASSGLDPIVVARLAYRHGARAAQVVERVRKDRREAAVVCECEPVIEAEIRWACAEEGARTADDVSRRTRLGSGACGGMRCAARCGRIVAEETGRTPAEGVLMAVELLEGAARRRLAVVGPQQARMEALALASVRAELGIKRLDEPGDERSVLEAVGLGGGPP
ncbi:MAG: glycerol-3-phosphate dehydrogenase/oxidase [Polyangiaceae bacterium]|nr:glycerol-3-phosphate dehydrogenase/oxidase [Polyangiaceae bacterium]